MKLQDKVVIVTGGAQGIGKAISLALAGEGAKICFVDVQEESVRLTSEEVARDKKVETMALKADVSKFAETEEMAKKVLDKFGRIDILINNAGITRDNLLMRMSDEEWDLVLSINLKGVFNCSKAVVRPMFKQHSGKIVNIASVVGQMGNAGQANYAASKGGVIALTKTCAREFASRNLQVNAIAPGFIRTKMTESLSQEVKDTLAKQIPLGRLGEPEDVAKAALFLSSADADYITGQVIAVNGGMYM
ncbi:MAG: 3-oxoacyl-[acyl-carrier-protein] reductase [Elusimicrobiota bacterium]